MPHQATVTSFSGFKIDGIPCRLVPLTRGQYAIVEEADYPLVGKHKYYARYDRRSGKFYAVRSQRAGKRNLCFYMHRELLGLSSGSEEQGDHVEPMATTLNIRTNLRLSGYEGNGWNKRVRKDSATGLKWAQYHKKSGLYASSVKANKVRYSLGYHRTAMEAHLVALAFSRKTHGKFSRS